MIFLTTRPLWISAALLIGLLTLLAMAGPVAIRRRVALEKLSANNEVAGFKFATVGVLYAVLLAFTVVVVWEKFSDAEHTTAREAGAAVTIYRLAQGIGPDPSNQVRDSLTDYLNIVVARDWPAMARGEDSGEATRALDRLYSAALTFAPSDLRGAGLQTELLHQLDELAQARRERLVMASGAVPGIVWVVLFVGALLTIGFTYFFGTENLRAQTLMTGILAVLIFSGLLIIIAIDRPFAGTVRVEPTAILAVLSDFH